MKKVSLVVMEKTREESLTKLRELGLVHLERKNVASESLSRLLDRKARIENALGILRPYEAELKKTQQGAVQPAPPRGEALRRRSSDSLRPEDAFYSADAVNTPPRPDLVALILEYADERKSLQDRTAALSKERSRVEDWGDFRGGDFAWLEERGLKLIPYKLSSKSFAALSEDTPFLKLGENKNSVYILSLGREIPDETPFALPEYSLGEIDGQLEKARLEAADIEKRLLSLGSRTPILETEGRALLKQVEFETARLGMDSLEDVSPERSVAWITGFIPQEDLGRLKSEAA
ncbi:MAG: hypothetical protein LBF63_07485 [Treponema sp.]|nr:hypothetical protein [Treponema sp.]